VMNADGSGLVNLTPASTADFAPAWSPDGTKLSFTSTRDGDSEVYTMSADGSGAVDLSKNEAEDTASDWQSLAEAPPPSPPPPPAPQPPPPGPDGKPGCRVPSLAGRTLAQARKRLRAVHCRLGRVTRAYSPVEPGRVIRTRPKRGTRLAQNAKVRVVLSRGLKR